MMVMFAAAGYLALAAAVLALRGRPAYPAAKAMAGAGFCVLAAGSPCTGTLLFAAGSVLFWASDLVLLGLYFSRRRGSRVLHIANLTSYYAGMLLMALSMAWPAGFA